MPVYCFTIHGDVRYPDSSGTELKDDPAAVVFGTSLARDLRQDFGMETGHWSIVINEGERTVQRIEFKSIE